ncbi:MAG: carboxypeptidase regulatory-like domain-containing protein, partial [Gemmatimonadetes bacterium]|nr:carboxypeptidase regulatory-like domain-containing protein [Gemmatimonadota bacterium]
MCRPTLLFLPLLVALLSAPPLRAQIIRGELAEAGTGKPIEAAFVALVDGTGVRRAGALTDSAGRFVLRPPAAGRYTLRAERIGNETAEVSVLVAAGAAVDYRLEMQVEAIPLAAVEAEARRRCVVRPEEGLGAARLWEEARKALDVAAWAQDERLYEYEIRRYERELDVEGQRVKREAVEARTMWAEQPFVSLAPEKLAESGYVQNTAEGTFYYAPDAHVLLSDSFLDQHCFWVQPPRPGEEHLIGLVFEPAGGRKLPEIRGVLSFDRASSELRSLEYQYTNLPRAVPAERLGGSVDFERLDNGAWVLRRWWIRMPVIGVRRAWWRPVGEPDVEVLLGIKEVGGEVAGLAARTPKPVLAQAQP